MKRIVVLVFSVIIVFSLAISAYAASPLDYVGMTGSELGYDFAWCQAFVNRILDEFTSNPIIYRSDYCPSCVSYYKSIGLWFSPVGYQPSDFDLVYFDFNDNNVADHVGVIYDGFLLEGNSQDSVRYSPFDSEDSNIMGFVHPFEITNVVTSETRVVNPVTPASTSGLKKIILDMIGNYDAIIVEYAYQSSQGYTSYLREVQIDYPWIAAVCVFALVLLCFFRILGVLFKKGG